MGRSSETPHAFFLPSSSITDCRQKIIKDPTDVAFYSTEPSHRIFVHTVTSEASLARPLPPSAPLTTATNDAPQTCELLTGVLPSNSENDLPWFTFYDESPPTSQAGHLQNVHSLAQVDDLLANSLRTKPVHDLRRMLDPNAAYPCSKCGASKKAACVFRPCNHLACEACLGASIEGSQCGKCGERIAQFVGFRKPVEGRKLVLMEGIEEKKRIVGVEVGEKGAWTV